MTNDHSSYSLSSAKKKTNTSNFSIVFRAIVIRHHHTQSVLNMHPENVFRMTKNSGLFRLLHCFISFEYHLSWSFALFRGISSLFHFPSANTNNAELHRRCTSQDLYFGEIVCFGQVLFLEFERNIFE